MDAGNTLLHGSNNELKILKALRRNTSKPIVQDFTDHYVPVVKTIMDSRMEDSTKKLKANAAYLTGLAGIATLLSSVQIGFFPLISNPDCGTDPQPRGCESHVVFIRAVVNFFSYLALSFDALGALFALLTARSLLRVSSQAQDLMDDKYNLDGYILGQLENPDAELLATLQDKTDDLYGKLKRLEHIIKTHTGGPHGVLGFIMLGMICFFVALVAQVVQSQPLKFWIPFVLSVAAMIITLGGNEKRHHTNIWEDMKEFIFSRTRVSDAEKGPDASTPDRSFDKEGAPSFSSYLEGLPTLEHDAQLNGKKYDTPLHEAARTGDTDYVKSLLEGGTDPNIRNQIDEASKALQIASRAGKLEVVLLLIKRGANVNFRGGKYDTALQAAAAGGNLKIVRVLLDSGAHVNILGGEYGTALQAAAFAGHLEIVKMLLAKKADVHLQGGKYGTALAASSTVDIAELLLKNGADPNEGSEHGTLLQRAAHMGKLDVVKLILERGADVNARCGPYGTPLQAASAVGAVDVVQLLLSGGADPNINNTDNGTALELASRGQHLKIIRLLFNHGANEREEYHQGDDYEYGGTSTIVGDAEGD
ncbi:ankyrin repeat-containing domain protein [Mycena crocata]|nr:ankyrin repeat-containing domain protein [Mycena crocata]